ETGRHSPVHCRVGRRRAGELHARPRPGAGAAGDARSPRRAMKWWARASLSTKIFLAFSALVLGVLLSTLWFTQLVVSRDARATLSRELLTTGQVFDGLLRERAARLQNYSLLLTSDFAMKRAIATHFDAAEFDPATLASAADSWRGRIDVELLWITDEKGVLLASSPKQTRV